MKSKEALKELINYLDLSLDSQEKREATQLFITIKKDLEALEILKKYLYYDNNNHFIKMKPIRKSIHNFDYEDLKEWLENDK